MITGASRRAMLLSFFNDPPADVLTAAEEVGRAREAYADDTEREIADLEAGRHPLQGRSVAPR